MKKAAIITFVVSLFLITSTFTAGAREKSESITVGLSLTYTGALGGTAAGISDGLLDHLMWINHQGGIEYKDPKTGKLKSIRMKIKWEDNAYNPSKSLSIYKRLKAAGAKVIFILGSTPGEAISSSLSRDKIPGVAFYAGGSPAGFRPKPIYYSTSSGTLIDEFCTTVKWYMSKWKGNRPPRIGGVSLDVPSFRVLGDPQGCKAYVEKAGAEWVGVEFMPMMVTDTTVQLTKLVKEKADLIINFGGTSHTVVIANDMSRLGIDPNKVNIACATPSWDERVNKLIPKKGEGFYVSSPYVFAFEDLPGVRLAKEVRQWRGRGEDMGPYLKGFIFGYITKTALRNALEKVGYEKISPTDIRNAFFSLKDVDVAGLAHDVTVKNPNHPQYFTHTRFSRIEEGQFKIVSDWIEFEEIEYGR